MDESLPEPQTDGALNPPPRVPPTALATMDGHSPLRPEIRTPTDWRKLLNKALDRLDTFADRIASVAGLR
jgi:hypothetical protein